MQTGQRSRAVSRTSVGGGWGGGGSTVREGSSNPHNLNLMLAVLQTDLVLEDLETNQDVKAGKQNMENQQPPQNKVSNSGDTWT